MLRAAASLWLACLAVLPLSACFEPVQFEEQLLQFRYDAEQDELELLLLYRGMQSELQGDQDSKHAYSMTERMLSKSRLIVLGNWPLVLDLDAYAALADLPKGDPQRPAEGSAGALALTALAGIEIRAVGVVRDPGHGLSMYQFLRVPKASLLVQALNQSLNELILEPAAPPEGRKPDADVDPILAARIEAKARSQGVWVSLTGARLELRAPSRPKDVAQVLADQAQRPNAFMGGLLGALSELESCEDEMRATFLPDARGRWRMRFETPASELRAGATVAFAEAFRKAGFVVEDEPKWADVRELLVQQEKAAGR